MECLAELREVNPDGEMTVVGGYPVFRFAVSTPAHTFLSLVFERDGWLVELTARDGSYDDRLAEFLLRTVAAVDLPDPSVGLIRVVAAAFPAPWSFEYVVLVPPAVARRFEHESEELERVTYWAVPAFAGEFADRGDAGAFEFQLYRNDGRKVSVVQWDRTPGPIPRIGD